MRKYTERGLLLRKYNTIYLIKNKDNNNNKLSQKNLRNLRHPTSTNK